MMEGGFEEPVTTLRITNIPSHTNEADFNCWFLFAPGFYQAKLDSRGGVGMQTGWARFEKVEDAQSAMQQLDGRQLTESPEGCILAVEFAKKNFKPPNPYKKRPYPDEEDQQSGFANLESVQPQHSSAGQHSAAQYGATQTAAAASVGAQYDPVNFDLSQYDLGEYGNYGGENSNLAATANAWTAAGTAPPRPSSTIWLGKLADTVTEEELQQVFPSLLGFERMKFVPPTADGKSAMCFAKFYTPETAEEALRVLSGYRLPSSPSTPLQVQIAKNDLDVPSRGPPIALGQMQMRSPVPMASAGLQQGECDTMFIGNLSSAVTEPDLARVLTAFPGFVRLKFVSGQRPMAFALFNDVISCKQAIDSLHGQALPSAPEQAMLCQFAKNSLDRPTPKWLRAM